MIYFHLHSFGMAVRFNPDSEKQPYSRKRPVPNYSRRAVQFRLAVLVFAVMMVLVMMQKAGQPETWAWLDFKKPDSQDQGHLVDYGAVDYGAVDYGAVDPRSIDTRFGEVAGDQEQPKNVVRIADAAALLTKESAVQEPAAESDIEAAESGPHDFEVAEQDFWRKTYDRFSSSDKDLLFHLLRSAIYREPPNEEVSTGWPELSTRITRRREKYYAEVRKRIAALDHKSTAESSAAKIENREDQKTRWTNTLALMQTFWGKQVAPALSAVATSEPIKRGTASELTELLDILELIALSHVQDNAMTSRKSDMQTWFGIFDRLQRASASEIADSSRGPVSYVQLFEQPDVFRDQTVTIRGNVRAAWWVDAPNNIHQIDRYYVYWIRPDDGSNNPIAVYALEKPAGFPGIQKKPLESDAQQWDKEQWNEPVTVHGVFLKKWVYLSQDSSRICPLLLAKGIQWEPAVVDERSSELPGIFAILLTLMAVGLVAIAIAFIAYHLTSRKLTDTRVDLPEVLELDATLDDAVANDSPVLKQR